MLQIQCQSDSFIHEVARTLPEIKRGGFLSSLNESKGEKPQSKQSHCKVNDDYNEWYNSDVDERIRVLKFRKF